MKLLFSFFLQLSESIDEVLTIGATDDMKLMAVVTVHQEVLLYNIYSQELLQRMQMTTQVMYLSFLDSNSEYLFVVGYEDGGVVFCASHLKGGYKLQNKIFSKHKYDYYINNNPKDGL
jgi:hypothetical protein